MMCTIADGLVGTPSAGSSRPRWPRLLSSLALGLLCLSCTVFNPAHEQQDPCAESGDVCDPLARCVAQGTKFSCECPQGYRDVRGDGSLCRDRDECLDGSHDCDPVATCTNRPGSFDCRCPETHSDPEDGRRCEEIDVCLRSALHGCDLLSQVCVRLPAGGHRCDCKEGFTPADGGCADIDECETGQHDCAEPAECENDLFGGFRCVCPSGFSAPDGGVCELPDPCAPGTHGCDESAICVATDAIRYRCDCAEGFEKQADGRCFDRDECQQELCRSPATCVNTEGGFSCTCSGYYQASEDELGCVDERLQVARELEGIENAVHTVLGADGSMVIAGNFFAPLQLCDASHPHAGMADVFIASYDAQRRCRWVKTVGGIGSDVLRGLGVDASGNVVVSMSYYGAIVIAGRSIDSQGYRARVVAKLDAESGDALWAPTFYDVDADDQGAELDALAIDSAGQVLWAGALAAGVDLRAEQPQGSVAVDWDGLVAKLDGGDGSVLWQQALAGPGFARVTALSVDASDEVVFAGRFEQVVVIDGVVVMPGDPSDGVEGFAAKFDATGAAIWQRSLAGTISTSEPLDASAIFLGVGPEGHVVVGGSYVGRLGVAEPLLADSMDGWVASLDGASGQTRWQRRLGASGQDVVSGVGVDTAGRVVVSGVFEGELDLGDGLMPSGGGADLFVLSLDAAGQTRWSQRFGGIYNVVPLSFAVAPQGEIALINWMRPPLSLATLEVPEPAQWLVYLLELDP